MKPHLFILFTLWTSQILWAQELPEIIPPSPTAAALGEYGEIPVSQYTGIPSINIPLYQIQSRDISVPISLNYHAGGVKVEEEASWVGLGWSLNAGGVITRSIRGLDDLSSNGYPFDNTPMPNSDDQNNYDANNPQPSDFAYLSGLCTNSQDGEPDMFYFNFGNYSGKFILLPNSTVPAVGDPDVNVLLLSQDRLKIEALKHAYTGPLNDGEASLDWKVTSPDGFAYFFRVQEITKMKTGSGISEATADQVSTSSVQPYTVNTWYLDQIVSPSGEVVYFLYEEEDHGTESLLSRTQEHLRTVRGQAYRDCFTPPPLLNCELDNIVCTDNGITYSSSQRITKDVYLERIEFTNGHIEFETTAREDMAKEEPYYTDPQRLDQIRIYQRGNLLTSYTFHYSYFHNNSNDIARKRLKLLSVSESNGGLSKPSHIFEYFPSYDLANKDSKNQDHWGYHNGADNYDLHQYFPDINPLIPSPNPNVFSTLIPQYELYKTSNPIFVGQHDLVSGYDEACTTTYCDPNSPDFNLDDCYQCWTEAFQPHYYHGANREADPTPNLDNMKSAALRKIIYPTGGYTEFDYEAHEYGNFPDQDSWEEVTKTVTDCGLNTNTLPGISCGFNTTETFTLTEPAFLLLEHYVIRSCGVGSGAGGGPGCNPVPLGGPQDYATISGSGVNLAFQYADLDQHAAIEQYTYHYLQPGTYTLTSIAVDDAYVRINASWSNPKIPLQPLLAKRAGGLRIKSMTTHDDISSANDQHTQYQYTKMENGLEKSSGKLMAPVQYHYFQLEESPILSQTHYICHNFILSSGSNIPLGGSANGSSVGYDKVTVIYGENGENGKSVYEYFNTEEEITDFFFPNLPTRIYNSNGLLGLETHYRKNQDGSYQIVSQTENQYNNKKFDNDLRAANPASNTVNIKALKYYGQSCNMQLYIHLPQIKFYDISSEWWRITKSIQRDYDAQNPAVFLTRETAYEYTTAVPGSGEAGYLRGTSVLGNDGIKRISRSYFPSDYTGSNLPTAITEMQNRYILTPVIEQLSLIEESGVESIVGGTYTQFGLSDVNISSTVANTIVPKEVFTVETLDPIPHTSFPLSMTAPAGNMNTHYAPSRISYDQYDLKGNIRSVKQTSGQEISYIWGYETSIPTAKILNASPHNVAYTSFEYGVDPDPTSNERWDGNWEFLGTAAGFNLNDVAKTGIGKFDLNSQRTVRAKVKDAGLYVVSFWTTKDWSDFSFPGTTPVVVIDGEVNQGWKFYEVEVSLPLNGTFSITGSSTNGGLNWIDELRLYPKDAQMSTISYDKTLRIHSMTDVNNRSSYFSYDDLNRLSIVKDQKGNIIQTLDYQYKQ